MNTIHNLRNIFYFGAFVLLLMFEGQLMAQDGSKQLSLTVDYQNSKIQAQITNTSEQKIAVFEESCSWGWGHWRVLIIRGENLFTLYQNPDKSFTMNSPFTYSLEKGDSKKVILDLNDDSWKSLQNSKPQIQKGDVVIVIYDVPASDEGLKRKVWYGIIAASIAKGVSPHH